MDSSENASEFCNRFTPESGNSLPGGGLSNSDTISAANDGFGIKNVTTFAGDIANTGKISAAVTGIAVFGGTLLGAIVDSGTIQATGAGIVLISAGVISGGITVGSQGVIAAISGGRGFPSPGDAV